MAKAAKAILKLLLSPFSLAGCKSKLANAASGRPIDRAKDPRWDDALKNLRDCGFRSQANDVDQWIDGGLFSQNPNGDTHGTTTGHVSVIGARQGLNASDIAMELLGEWQRQVKEPDNTQLAALENCLKSHGKPPTMHWAH